MFILIRKLKYLVVMLLLLPLSSCGISGSSVSGKVIDKSTGQPIEGAIVVAYWKGDVPSPAHSTTYCFHVESTATDADGKYRIPRWLGRPRAVMNQAVYITAYKEGYQRAQGMQGIYERELEPFTGTREEKLKHVRKLVRVTTCGGAGKNQRTLYWFYEKLYYDSLKFIDPSKDQEFLRWLREVAASAWIGADSDMKMGEHDSKVEEFLRDHMK